MDSVDVVRENGFKQNVGIISTYFSETMFNRAFNLISLSPQSYVSEIEKNEISLVIIDNDLYETDHKWFKSPRGHIINFLKNNSIKILLIKNTQKEFSSLFKAANSLTTYISLEKNVNEYQFDENLLKAPILINHEEFNPIKTSEINKSIDILYFNQGVIKYSPHSKMLMNSTGFRTDIFCIDRITREGIIEFLSFVRESKILYLNFNKNIDEKILYYIELISCLYSTYVIYDYNYKINCNYGFNSHSDMKNIAQQHILLNNDFQLQKKIIEIQGWVFKNNTTILKNSIYEYFKLHSSYKHLPKISIITATNRKENLLGYLKQVRNQEFVEVEVIIATHGFTLNNHEKKLYRKIANVNLEFIYIENVFTLGHCLNSCIKKTKYPIIAKIDDDDYYSDKYLFNQWIAMQYSEADLVGKYDTIYYFDDEDLVARRNQGQYYNFTDFVMGATIMCNSTLLKELLFNDLWKSEDSDLLKRIKERGGKIFVNHPFDFCVFRNNETKNHTWKVSNMSLLRNARILGYGNPNKYI